MNVEKHTNMSYFLSFSLWFFSQSIVPDAIIYKKNSMYFLQ